MEKKNIIDTIHKINKKDENAFIIACKQNDLDIVKYILSNLPNTYLMKIFLEEGLDIITKSKHNSIQCKEIKNLIDAKLKNL